METLLWGLPLKKLGILVHLSCRRCAPHKLLPDPSYSSAEKWARPIFSHQTYLQTSDLQREKRKMVPCFRMGEGQDSLFSNTTSALTCHHTQGPGAGQQGGFLPLLQRPDHGYSSAHMASVCPGYKGLYPVASASCPCLRLAVHFTSASTRQTSRNSAVWTRQVYSQCILMPSALCAENFDWEFHKAPF